LADGAPFDPAASSRGFRIATVDYAVVALVLPMLERVRAGGARVELVVSPLLPGFEDDLASGHLDLAILPRRRSSRALVWRKLLQDPFISVVKRGHPRVRGRPTLAEFAALSHVVVVPEAGTRNALDERLKAIGLSRHVALRVPSFLPALVAVASSELVLTAPQSLVRAFAEPFALSVFAPPLPVGGITVSAAWHERQRRDPGHAWLRAQLVRAASGQR
jgi:DNA-binding transcriptional LysR family regulator